MIAWRAATIAEGKRFPVLPIVWIRSLPSVTLAAETIFTEENAWATQ